MKNLLFILGCIGLIAFLAIRYISAPPTTSQPSSPQPSSTGGGGFTSSSSSGGGSVPSPQISPSSFAKAQQFISIANQIPSPQTAISPGVSPSFPNHQINTSLLSQSIPHISQLPSPPPTPSPKPLPSTSPNSVPRVAPPESLDINVSPPLQRRPIPTLQFPQSPVDFLSYLITLWLLQLFEKEGLLNFK